MPVSSAQPMVLAALTPTRGQQGLALFAALLLTVTFLFAMIFAGIHLPAIPTFIPIVVTITVINDVITAALLFAQFSVVRSRALLALACGYLLTGLLLIPYALTFPLTFSQTGLLGAGTQTAAWLWMTWIFARPTTVIVYAMLKPGTAAKPQLPTSRSPRRAIVLSVLAAVCGVLAADVDHHST